MRQKVEAAGFTYVQRQPTSGYGDAIRTAIVEANSSHIGFMDADNSHDPVFFVNAEPYLKNGADLVVGSRYMNGGSTANGLLLRFLSHVVNVVFRAILGTNISDLSNSQKVYKRALINRPLTCQNFDIIEELVWNVITYGNKTEVFEIPATFEKRLYGETKRKLIPFTVGYARTAVRFLFFKLHRHFGASCK